MALPPTTTPSNSTPRTGTGLNVIALVSGGKDSLFSLLHCIRNGHTVIALANLYPKPTTTTTTTATGQDDGDEEDIDSFMYQTIGHSVIPLYETALGIPLYRAPIIGGAVDTSRVYRDHAPISDDGGGDGGDGDQTETEDQENQEEEDETESLTPLLRMIQAKHPEANAVSAGAILSTYQRTRIEHVAARLRLAPLAWLWMYPDLPAPVERGEDSGSDAGLLEDMAACGCEARIIKVASGGLDEGVLWEDVSGPGPGSGSILRSRIVKAMKRFSAPEDIRGAVLGEGGEYESLALDGPGFLWKKKIVVDERLVRRGEGGVGYIMLKGARCVPKEVAEEDITVDAVRRPALLNGLFGEVLDGLLAMPVDCESVPSTDSQTGNRQPYEPVQAKHGRAWTISNLTAPEAGPGAGEQMSAITEKMKTALLSTHDDGPRSTDDIVFATVLLRSMTDFTSMNNIYNSLFKKPNPPARATVACGDALPEGVNTIVSFVVDLGPREARQALHVQSRSYWAPANIGPYSQALSIPLQTGTGRLVYIAGQIPLEPASMEMVTGSDSSWNEGYALRAVLALQHLWRIGTAMQVDWWVGAVAYLTDDDGEIKAKAHVAWRLWEKMHARPDNDEDDDEESALDAWDIKYGHQAYEQQFLNSAETPSLPNFTVLQSNETTVPPFFAAQIAELPRGSDVEWQGLGCRCERLAISEQQSDTTAISTCTTTIDKSLNYMGVEIGIEQDGCNLETCLQKILEMYGQSPSHVILYTIQTLSPGFCWPGQIVPCLSVWGRAGRRLRAGVVIQSL